MALENKLGLTDSAALAREEERISKKKAAWLFESGTLDALTPGTFASLREIHRFLFEDIYDFAGKLRTVNLAKGNFRFAPLMYLEAALANIEKMPQSTYDEIIEKYVEMNIAGFAQRSVEDHPEGICLGILPPEELRCPLWAHGMGGRGSLTDLINFSNGFHCVTSNVYWDYYTRKSVKKQCRRPKKRLDRCGIIS